MTKPIGPICNLDCQYCYYLHKEDLYAKGNSWRMKDSCLETYIRDYMKAQPANAGEVTFAWQGGEPTLMGIEFFSRCVELQQKHARPGLKIANTIQTNGILLDEQWCSFFRRHGFLVGLSIDGPAEMHDRYRVDHQGKGTHAAVIRAMRLLKKFSVDFNALVVVNRHNGEQGAQVYRYLRDAGCQFIQFIPIVERTGVGRHAEGQPLQNQHPIAFDQADTGVSSRSVLPDQFGRFLTDVFDEWIQRDVGRVFVQIFDQALSAWVGVEPSLCVFRRTCGRALAMEHNGDVYSCDHFVEPEYLLGNLTVTPLEELINAGQQQQFGMAKLETLPDYCRQCEVRFVCNGECPKNRFLMTRDGQDGLNYLCVGYRAFFNHIDKPMRQMAQLVKSGKPASAVMSARTGSSSAAPKRSRSASPANTINAPPQRSSASLAAPQKVGRNDPCSCGSGRKYKACCMKR